MNIQATLHGGKPIVVESVEVTDEMVDRAMAAFTNGQTPWANEREAMRRAFVAALSEEKP